MAKKVKNTEKEIIIENILNETLDSIMEDRFAAYTKYVIQDRSIPDIRDGLKPVQRRIIYSMFKNHNTSKHPTRKCARVVGDVIGKYHPHGDTSIYDALVRMSQDWKLRYPLTVFQGNNGSMDGDQAAAYRYTEARLAKIAEELIVELDKDTVNMNLTFDDTDFEPSVLPAKFPNLLVNGSEGIAVALSPYLPPHNLKEVIEATIYRIRNPRCDVNALRQFIIGPDYPTGGIIYKSPSLDSVYETGEGKYEVCSNIEFVEGKTCNSFVINEIPFGVVKINLVNSIDKIRFEKSVPGLIEVRDESDRNGLRIVIDIKKDAKKDIILSCLLSRTKLRINESVRMIAISNDRPVYFNLITYLDAFIDHRVDVFQRKSKYDLKRSEVRLHIVDGLIRALSILDELVDLIRKSSNKESAKKAIIETYDFSANQTEAILNMQLYKLSNTDVTILQNEQEVLRNSIEFLSLILSDEGALKREIIKELKQISKEYGDERRTRIEEKRDEVTFTKRDLIEKEETLVTVTRDGYIKRCSRSSASAKASVGTLPGIKDGDTFVFNGYVETTDFLICFTNCGNYIYVPVHEIKELKYKVEGPHLNTFINGLSERERIVKVFAVTSFRKDLYFALITRMGQIKRTKVCEYEATRINRPIQTMRILSSDQISDVALTNGNSDLYIFTKNGEVSVYNENQFVDTSLKSSGVKGLKMSGDDCVVSLLSYDIGQRGRIMIFTDNGHVRNFEISNVEAGKRLQATTKIVKSTKTEPHNIINVFRNVDKNERTIYATTNSITEPLFEFVWSDYLLNPMGTLARADIKLGKDILLKRIFTIEEPVFVNDKIVSQTPILEKDNINVKEKDDLDIIQEFNSKEEAEEDYEQTTLFDLSDE